MPVPPASCSPTTSAPPAEPAEQPSDAEPEQPGRVRPSSPRPSARAEARQTAVGVRRLGLRRGRACGTSSSDAGAEVNCKVQPPVAPGGRFSKDAFAIDLDARHRHLPSRTHRGAADGRRGTARALRPGLRRLPAGRALHHRGGGRTIYVGPYEQQLTRARPRQQTPPGRPTTKPPARRSSARSRT